MEAGGEAAAAAAKPVKKLIKDVGKSQIKVMEEAHAAEAAKAEQAFQKKVTAHKEAKQQVMKDYKEAIQEHTAATKEASATESAAKAKTGIAVEHQNELAGLLKQNLELTDEKIATALGKQFDQVQEAVQYKTPKVEIERVVKAAEKAKAGLLFEDSRSAFDRIMTSIEPGQDLASKYQLIPRKPSAPGLVSFQDSITGGSVEMREGFSEADLERYVKTRRAEMAATPEAGKSDLAAKKIEQATQAGKFRDVRQAYTKLNDYLYGGGEVPPDLYKAVKQVRDALGDVSQNAADSVGLGGKHSKVMREWSEYKDVFHDKSAIAKGGSPIRRILDAEDPAFVVDQLKGKAGDRLLEEIGKFSDYGADKALAGRLKGFIGKIKEMPSSAGELPAKPKRPEFPKAPEHEAIAPFDRAAESRKILADRIKKTAGGMGLAGGGALLYHLLFGDKQPPSAGGAVP
jgi:hypothetical protein